MNSIYYGVLKPVHAKYILNSTASLPFRSAFSIPVISPWVLQNRGYNNCTKFLQAVSVISMMAFQWNAWDNEAKCEQFSDANYGGSGGGSSSSESNSAFSSLYHFPSKPMIHPACRRREKCSLLAFSLGLRTFLTTPVPLGSLPDSLELGVFE